MSFTDEYYNEKGRECRTKKLVWCSLFLLHNILQKDYISNQFNMVDYN